MTNGFIGSRVSSVLIDKIASALFPSQEASYTVVAAATVRRRMAHGLLEADPARRCYTGDTSASQQHARMKCRAKRVHAPRLRPLFTRVLHAARSPSTQHVVHALRSLDFATFTPFVHAFIDPFTRTVHAFGARVHAWRSPVHADRHTGSPICKLDSGL